HGSALREQQRGQHISHLAASKAVDLRIIGGTFNAAIPGIGVGVAVLIPFSVGFIMSFVVRNKIVERKAIMSGDEIDARPRSAALLIEDGARSAQTLRQRCCRSVTLPKPAHVVAEFIVPLRPARRKFPDLVATWTAIPRLRN